MKKLTVENIEIGDSFYYTDWKRCPKGIYAGKSPLNPEKHLIYHPNDTTYCEVTERGLSDTLACGLFTYEDARNYEIKRMEEILEGKKRRLDIHLNGGD